MLVGHPPVNCATSKSRRNHWPIKRERQYFSCEFSAPPMRDGGSIQPCCVDYFGSICDSLPRSGGRAAFPAAAAERRPDRRSLRSGHIGGLTPFFSTMARAAVRLPSG